MLRQQNERYGGRYRVSVLTIVALASFGCAWTTRGARPGDMSVEGHRTAADAEMARAEAHNERYELDGRRHGTPWGDEFDSLYSDDTPNTRHLRHARLFRLRAQHHVTAAETLERHEQQLCRDVSPAVRGDCRLVTRVESVRNIEGGVQIRLRGDESVEAAIAYARCHQAIARARGFEGVRSCPMSLRDVAVEEGSEPQTLTLTVAGGDQQLSELRQRIWGLP